MYPCKFTKERPIKMKEYYNLSDTPLKFHNFFRYLSLPLGLLISIGDVSEYFSAGYPFSFLFLADVLYFIAYFILALYMIIGFIKWSKTSWYCLNTYLALNTLYSFFILMFSIIYSSPQTPANITRFIAILLYSFAIYVYYQKRKPLFFSDITSKQINTMLNQKSGEQLPLINDKFCQKSGLETFDNKKDM